MEFPPRRTVATAAGGGSGKQVAAALSGNNDGESSSGLTAGGSPALIDDENTPEMSLMAADSDADTDLLQGAVKAEIISDEQKSFLEKANSSKLQVYEDKDTSTVDLGNPTKTGPYEGPIKELLDDIMQVGYDEIFEDIGLDFDNPVTSTLENPDNILKQKGLVKNRPEIIGLSEFKPILDEVTDQNESTIKIAVDSINEKKVTNVSRLIELHRQIREFILNASKVIKDKIYGELNDYEYFQAMKDITNQNYIGESLLKPTLAETIESLISYYINGEYEINNSNIDISTFKSFVNNRSTNTFFRGLVEVIVLDIIVIEMTKQLSTILNYSKSINNAWSLKNYQKTHSLIASEAISNSYYDAPFEENKIAGKSEYFSSNTGIDMNDISLELYQQLGASIYAELCCVDSVNFTAGYLRNNTRFSEDNHIQFGLMGDLSSIILKLSKINYTSYATTNISSLTNGKTRIDDDNIFELYKGVKDKSGTNVNNSLVNLSEVIVSYIFDTGIRKTRQNYSDNQMTPSINYNVGVKGDASAYIMHNFYLDRIGANTYNGKGSYPAISDVSQFNGSLFLDEAFGLKSGTLNGSPINYSPLLKENTNEYFSGYNYFVKKLEKSETSEFYGFKNRFYSGANDVVSDFYSMFPDYKVADTPIAQALLAATGEQEVPQPFPWIPLAGASFNTIAKEFLTALKDDLTNLLTVHEVNYADLGADVDYYGSGLSLIALIGRNSEEQALRSLRASYWDLYASAHYRDEGSGISVSFVESETYARDFFRESLRKAFSTIFGGSILTYDDDDDTGPARTSLGSVGSYPNSSFDGAKRVLSSPSDEYTDISTAFENGSLAGADYETYFSQPGITRAINLEETVNLELMHENLIKFYKKYSFVGNGINYTLDSYHYFVFMTVRWLLKKTIFLYSKTSSSNKLLYLYGSGKEGLLKGIEDAISEFDSGEELEYTASSQLINSNNNSRAYNTSKDFCKRILGGVEYKQDKIRDSMLMIPGHASAIQNAYDSITTPTGATQDLIVNTLSANNLKPNENVADDFLFTRISNFNNSFTPTDLHTNRKKFFITDNNFSPINDRFILNKTKLMYSVLTQPGFGMLKSEKFGNKEILNIGLTKGIIDFLKKEASLTTGNEDYEKSPYVVISVYKQSHFHETVGYEPKIFVFDTSINIEDFDVDGITRSNHLLNYNDNLSFEQLLNSVQVNRYFVGNENDIITDVKIGNEACFNRDIFLNHIFDYVLKEYQKIILGLDYSESSFLLRESIIPSRTVRPGLALGGNIVNEIESFVFKINRIYGSIVGPDLQSEIFRMINVVKQSFPFSNIYNFEKIVTPKAFDKTYSIFINEKDFILNNPIAYAGSDYNLFKDNQQPNYSSSSKLLKVAEELNAIGTNSSVITDYLYESSENAATANNYYVNVGILPINFTEDSDIIFSQITGI